MLVSPDRVLLIQVAKMRGGPRIPRLVQVTNLQADYLAVLPKPDPKVSLPDVTGHLADIENILRASRTNAI